MFAARIALSRLFRLRYRLRDQMGTRTSIFRCSLEYAASKSTGAPRQDGLNSGRIHRGELVARMKKVVITACGDESKLAIVESDLPDPVVGEVQLSLLSRIQRIEG
jgi:hypothetical protein